MFKNLPSPKLRSEDENYLVTYSQFEETKKPYEHKDKKGNLIQKTSTKTERAGSKFWYKQSFCLHTLLTSAVLALHK